MFDQSQIDGLNRILGDWAVVKRSRLHTESIVIGNIDIEGGKCLIVYQQEDPATGRTFWLANESDLSPEVLANSPSLPTGMEEHKFYHWFDLKMFIQDFFN